MQFFIPGILPITLAAFMVWRDWKKGWRPEPVPRAGFWMLTALLLFAFWCGGYFLADAATTEERARYLTPGLETQVPLLTDFSLIYILVFPLFFLPFFALRSERALRRAALSNFLTLSLCTLTFFVFPVTFARPALPGHADELGAWILSLVHGADPAWNCLPSEHCAMALVAALALLQERRWLGTWALVTAIGIAFSTLCLKQHYLVDGVIGFVVALGMTLGARWQGWERLSLSTSQKKKFGGDGVSSSRSSDGLQDSSEG
ncbi:MAG: phosphatase PAP2 family protein [Myxococcales bacterium]|nr:phosphatase PAP2 family protein [Myxococcales bacterium]